MSAAKCYACGVAHRLFYRAGDAFFCAAHKREAVERSRQIAATASAQRYTDAVGAHGGTLRKPAGGHHGWKLTRKRRT